MGIIEIDMHIRDQRVLDWMRAHRDNAGEIRVTLAELAQQFRCTEKTAWAIVKRLVGAGHLVISHSVRRDGYRYKVIDGIQRSLSA